MTDERLGHGLVGNGRVLGLVHPSTAIEWLCMPRFDSPSVFGRLLDAKQGGVFRFLLDGQEIVGDSSYVTNTNVLRTVVSSTSGTFEVLDFAPRYRAAREIRAPIELVRLLRPLEGSPRVTVDFDPRPDFSSRRCRSTTKEGPSRFGVARSPSISPRTSRCRSSSARRRSR